MAHEFKAWLTDEMSDVALRPGVVIVDAENVLALRQESFAEVRP